MGVSLSTTPYYRVCVVCAAEKPNTDTKNRSRKAWLCVCRVIADKRTRCHSLTRSSSTDFSKVSSNNSSSRILGARKSKIVLPLVKKTFARLWPRPRAYFRCLQSGIQSVRKVYPETDPAPTALGCHT